MNMNPRRMQKMMQQLGMSVDEIDASEVIIKKKDGSELHITNPQVSKMLIQGKEMYQVSGNASESEGGADEDVSDDDVEMITSQTGVSPEAAKEALQAAHGDLAKAILDLQEE
ncbi:MAG: nascent polypeptide-associated complex protein [archaeon]